MDRSNSKLDKFDILHSGPYGMESYFDSVHFGNKLSVFQDIKNMLIEEGNIATRKGCNDFSDTNYQGNLIALFYTALTSISSTSPTDMLLAKDEGNGYLWYKTSTLGDMSKVTATDTSIGDGTNGQVSTSYPGMFRTFNNLVYYSNGYDPVVSIDEDGAAYRAGIPSPDYLKEIQYCEDSDDWTAATGTASDDQASTHYVQGDQGVKMKVDSGSNTGTFTASVDLDLTSFENGETASDSDYIAFNAYRYVKDGITDFQILFSTGDESFTDYYSCVVYTSAIANWIFSPKQRTVYGKWANDGQNNVMFDVRLRKEWFASTGSPDWSEVKAVRISLTSSSGDDAEVTLDRIRLEKTPPVAAPYRKQVGSFENGETWTAHLVANDDPTTLNRIYYFATEGVASLKIATGTYAKQSWAAGTDLSEYADGVTIDSSHVVAIDMGGQGDAGGTSGCLTITFKDNNNATAARTYGFYTFLRGGGVRREAPLSSFSYSVDSDDFNWDNIHEVKLENKVGGDVYVDNLRIEPPRVSKWVDPFMPIDIIAAEEIYDWMEPYFRDHPVANALVTSGYQYYLNHNYATAGQGAYIYPDYEHKQFGICSLRLQAQAGSTFSMAIKKKLYTLNLAEYYIWQAREDYSWDPDSGEYGWVDLASVSTEDDDEFVIWVASPNWAAVREIKFRFYYDAEDTPPGDGMFGGTTGTPTFDTTKYWEYVIDYKAIQAKIVQVKQLEMLYEKYEDTLQSSDLIDTAARTALMSVGNFANQNDESIVPLGQDKHGWWQGLVKFKISDLMVHPSGDGAPSRQYIAGYEIYVTAGGDNAEVCFDNWKLSKKGALKGQYWYRVVFEDKDGFYSAPSAVSEGIECEGSDAILTEIATPSASETRVRRKIILRLGGTRNETWQRIAEIPNSESEYIDSVPDELGETWIEKYFYEPPRAKIMLPVGNYMFYFNVLDRFKRYQLNRGYRSQPFVAHQVADYDAFDIGSTEDEITGAIIYNTTPLVFKNDSIWSFDPELRSPPLVRERDFGLVATRTLTETPYGLLGLHRRGVFIGDIGNFNPMLAEPIWDEIEAYSDCLSYGEAFYYDDYYFLFLGRDATNKWHTKGFACHLPSKKWTTITGIYPSSFVVVPRDMTNSLLSGQDYTHSVVFGAKYDTDDYRLATLFVGNTDFDTAITSSVTTKDFATDFFHRSKMLRRVFVLAKYLSSAVSLTVTPYVDQVAQSALTAQSISASTYDNYVYGSPQGNEGHLLGAKLEASGRLAISALALELMRRKDRYND